MNIDSVAMKYYLSLRGPPKAGTPRRRHEKVHWSRFHCATVLEPSPEGTSGEYVRKRIRTSQASLW